jgi:hypothetical protein
MPTMGTRVTSWKILQERKRNPERAMVVVLMVVVGRIESAGHSGIEAQQQSVDDGSYIQSRKPTVSVSVSVSVEVK